MLFRRDYNAFNYVGNNRNTTYKQASLGTGLRTGFPLTEYSLMGIRYQLVQDKITLDKGTFYTAGECDPTKAGRYLCDEIGTRITSLIGATYTFDNTNGIHPTHGREFSVTQDFAGLGGDVKYVRTRGSGTQYVGLPKGFVFSAHAEGGLIKALNKAPSSESDPIRLTDRFFGPQLRGFDIRGIGPRILRIPYDTDGSLLTDKQTTTDALGGHYYYQGRLEVEFPTNGTLKSVGLRPSIYIDTASVWGVKQPQLQNFIAYCVPDATTNPTGKTYTLSPGKTCSDADPNNNGLTYNKLGTGFKEIFAGNSPKPRLSVGIGVNWVSPFGPLRLDFAKALLKQKGDDTKLFTFNVGTQF